VGTILKAILCMQFDLIVIGGGAAGFYGAIQASEITRGLSILILEKSNKLLSKVRVSGGGRCNVTHSCYNPFELARHYPRGEKSLKNLFQHYNAKHTVDWFDVRGVALKTEQDGRMFPMSDSSQTIIDCFFRQVDQSGIKVRTAQEVIGITQTENGFKLSCSNGETYSAKKILVATGGSQNKQAYNFLSQLNHTIIPPIPSLFTFNDSSKKFKDLMGVSVTDAEIKIAGTKFVQRGPVLITHWGLSGPGVIKLSAWAAPYLYESKYEFTVLVNWLGKISEEELRSHLLEFKVSRAKQKVKSNAMFSLPLRLSQRLCVLAEVDDFKTWSELPMKTINRLIEFLIRCPFRIKGKTTFKEEFVTCGGVDLKEIDLDTMESKKIKNIFFAGEVVNIDGETGGFNFQSAWTTAFIAAKSIASGH
jgi:predicted Rossmann fold flavoprotein